MTCQQVSRDKAKEVMDALDKAYANKLRRRARRVIMGTGRRTQRARRPSNRVAEAFCPGRLTSVASNHGLDFAFALDLTLVDPDDGEPWDLDLEDKQMKALRLVEVKDPGLLFVSPECFPLLATGMELSADVGRECA